MVIRVATNDVESAKLLVVDLVGVLGGECVSLQADGDVQLELRGEVNGALVQTLEAVEHWLEQTSTASAEVWVDDGRNGPTRVLRLHAGSQRRATDHRSGLDSAGVHPGRPDSRALPAPTRTDSSPALPQLAASGAATQEEPPSHAARPRA